MKTIVIFSVFIFVFGLSEHETSAIEECDEDDATSSPFMKVARLQPIMESGPRSYLKRRRSESQSKRKQAKNDFTEKQNHGQTIDVNVPLKQKTYVQRKISQSKIIPLKKKINVSGKQPYQSKVIHKGTDTPMKQPRRILRLTTTTPLYPFDTYDKQSLHSYSRSLQGAPRQLPQAKPVSNNIILQKIAKLLPPMQTKYKSNMKFSKSMFNPKSTDSPKKRMTSKKPSFPRYRYKPRRKPEPIIQQPYEYEREQYDDEYDDSNEPDFANEHSYPDRHLNMGFNGPFGILNPDCDPNYFEYEAPRSEEDLAEDIYLGDNANVIEISSDEFIDRFGDILDDNGNEDITTIPENETGVRKELGNTTPMYITTTEESVEQPSTDIIPQELANFIELMLQGLRSLILCMRSTTPKLGNIITDMITKAIDTCNKAMIS